jgi:hypothetical protein
LDGAEVIWRGVRKAVPEICGFLREFLRIVVYDGVASARNQTSGRVVTGT